MMDKPTIRAFGKLLVTEGYRSFHLAFGDGNHRVEKWIRHAEAAPPRLRTLIDLFLLQRLIEPDRAVSVLGQAIVDELVASKLLVSGPRGTRTPGLILISFRSWLFFHELTKSPAVYFGNDSIALGMYQNPAIGGVALDLCSGTAIQAMIAAQHAKRVYAVEISPVAAQVARFNILLNGVEDKVELINASLEDYAASVTTPLDLVTFNPPLLPVPSVLNYPFVGDGGPDGLDVTRRALDLYLPLLAEDGAVECIGCGLGRNSAPAFLNELDPILKRHGARGQALLVGCWPLVRGEPAHESLVLTAAMNSEITCEVAHAVYDQHLRALGMDSMYTFFFRAERVADSGKPFERSTVLDLSKGNANWFV
jgi:methylase of polypeptide subunit release factors